MSGRYLIEDSRPWHAPSRLPYKIWARGRVKDQLNHRTLGTHDKDAMLMLFLSGRGSYVYPAGTLEVTRGMVGLILPDENVGVLSCDPCDPYDHFFCRFDGTEAMQTAWRIYRKHSSESPFYYWRRWNEAAEIFRDLITAPPIDLKRLVPSDALLVLLLSMLDTAFDPDVPWLTERSVRAYLQAHVSDPPSLEAMAAHFRVCKPHLCKMGKRFLGRTIVNEWLALKVGWGQTLLSDASLSVCEVAHRLGYADPFYFSKVFRKMVGLSPSQWRKGPRLPRSYAQSGS